MMNEALLSLLIQVPLVGVFVAFVLFMSKSLLSHWEHREQAEAQRRAEAMKQGLDTLRMISEQHRQSLTEIVSAIKGVDNNLTRHDSEEKERWRTLEAYIHSRKSEKL